MLRVIFSQKGIVGILMAKDPGKKARLILYDTVTNDLPDGIIINDRLIRDGFAKKNTNWTKQAGLFRDKLQFLFNFLEFCLFF